MPELIVLGVVALFVLVTLAKSVRIVPQARAGVVERLGVRADEAAMVGDSPEDDVEGARALGMRALLIDRENHFPDEPERLPDLYALPAALGLERPAGDTIQGR